ncbi:MAG: DUF1467 family protein [Paracoccus sp. (in: a-proteobacteria)]|nr:DUF1467 family protein [Paracoccus sp. (in: a-proteobacteria)]
MSLTGGIVMYAVLWFLSLFLVLPFGNRSQQDAGHIVPGTPAGAPHAFRAGRTALITTLIATVIWGVIAYIILGGFLSRDDIMNLDRMFR